MLDELIKKIKNSSYPSSFTNEDWFGLSVEFMNARNPYLGEQLLNALFGLTGIPVDHLREAFNNLASNEISFEHSTAVEKLNQNLQYSLSKIQSFLSHPYLKKNDFSALMITQTEWLAIANRFDKLHRQKITSSLFVDSLSVIRKVSIESLYLILSLPQPSRRVKRQAEPSDTVAKRNYNSFREGENPLISDSSFSDPILKPQLEDKGVRFTKLSPSTPERKTGRPTFRTPGGTKVKPVFGSSSGHTLFQPESPSSKVRNPISRSTLDKIKQQQPRLQYDKAEPIEFIVTLESMQLRAGVPRRKNTMGASASDVFSAHGVETSSKLAHWAHLGAHYLCAPHEILSSNPNRETVNLVPASAASNYNTLEAVERFIEQKLKDKITSVIRVRVEPLYEGEALIPSRLDYILNWKEEDVLKQEYFYIYPQSFHRLTKSMHQSFNVLRQEGASSTTSSDTEDLIDNKDSHPLNDGPK